MHSILKKFTLDFLNYDVKKINNIIKNSDQNIRSKSSIKFDPVTNIDIKINNIILKRIKLYFPNHNIKSEESNYVDNSSDYTWYIDPLDGTKNYIFDLNHYSVLVGLTYKNNPIFSLIYFPKLKEFYFSIVNKSYYYSFSKKSIHNFKELIKKSPKLLRNKRILTNTINTIKSKKIISFFKNKKYLFKISGADSMNLILISLNKTDLFIESGLKDTDVVPLLNFLKVNNIKFINWEKKSIIKEYQNSLIFYKNSKANKLIVDKFLKIV